MWLMPGRASDRKNVAPKLFMMAQLEHGAPPAMVKDKSGEGGHTAVGVLDAINKGLQLDVVLRRGGSRVKVRGCLVLMVEDTSYFGKAVIRELLVLVCLLLRDGLTVLSMWSESMSRSCM